MGTRDKNAIVAMCRALSGKIQVQDLRTRRGKNKQRKDIFGALTSSTRASD